MMRLIVSIVCIVASAAVACFAAPASPPNVLFIAVDDLNDWVEPLGGHPQVKTPNFTRLAKRGTTFTNAHCQATLCNPSRSSLLTGLRPSSTGIYGLQPGIRDVELTKDIVTLPQQFRRAGYFSAVSGKIFHDGSLKPKDRAAEFEVWAPNEPRVGPKQRISKLRGEQHPAMDWGPHPERDEDTQDWKIADNAIKALREAPKDKPFFIATGFRLPHVPCFAPQKWFDLYPDATLKMPPVKEDDRDDTPLFSWYLHWKLPEPRLSELRRTNEWRPLVRAYLATISFMDSQVGRVLDALEASGRASNTIVVLWSDHGWHLGEKAISGKNTLWDRSTRVPLIWAGPGIAANARSNRSVELLDIYPTLAELCGLAKPSNLEGHSIAPQLKNANAPREWPAITSHNQGNHTVRTEQWRYIRYADGSEELYDMMKDPNEWTNLVADKKLASVKTDLAKWLPKVDRPLAPNSAARVLTYDPATREAVWEGKKIVPGELEK
jgi:arylsulfatase A-like enzyme